VVEIRIDKRSLKLIILCGDNSGTMLLGRNWLDVIVPKWRNTFKINKLTEFFANFLRSIKSEYECVFKNEISEPIKFFRVDIRLTDNAIPVVHKPYPVPFSLKSKIENELDRLCKENVLMKVESGKWNKIVANLGPNSVKEK
jgi:hypothetical protein